MQAIETEVKLRVEDKEALEAGLGRLGFRCQTPRTFERNTLFDTPDRKLRSAQQILRVRQYGESWVVTHKQPPPGWSPEDRYKQRIETESRVEDGSALERIFAAVGFEPAFVYEKWRTEWADATGHCVVDETPIGLYAELEGPAEWIDDLLTKLAIPADAVTTLSYGRLFEQWQQKTGSAAQNMAFAEV